MSDLFTRTEVDFGGAMHAQNGIVADVGGTQMGILLQNLTITYNQQVARLYELGRQGQKARVYYVSGRANGTLQAAHVIGPGSVLVPFYTSFSDVCRARVNNLRINVGPNICEDDTAVAAVNAQAAADQAEEFMAAAGAALQSATDAQSDALTAYEEALENGPNYAGDMSIAAAAIALEEANNAVGAAMAAFDNALAVMEAANLAALAAGVTPNSPTSWICKFCVLTQVGVTVQAQDFVINSNSTIMFSGMEVE